VTLGALGHQIPEPQYWAQPPQSSPPLILRYLRSSPRNSQPGSGRHASVGIPGTKIAPQSLGWVELNATSFQNAIQNAMVDEF